MRYNEFKKPQLTEEQIVLDYCLGEITKEDAVLHLNELDPLSAFNKLKGIGGKLYSKGKDFFGGAKAGAGGKTGQARSASTGQFAARRSAAQTGQNVGNVARSAAVPAIAAGGGLAVGSALGTKPNAAYADDPSAGDSGMNTPSTPFYPDDPSAGDSGMNTTPAPTPAPTQRPKVAATAANTRDYDKTMALQKKLIAQGANIKADGLMGPKTRAAMKAAGMATSTPGSKVKQPGPSVTQNPAYNQTGMDDGDMPNAKPKIRTDMPGGPSRLNAFKLVYNKATPAQKKAMIARLRQAQAKRNAPPKPKKKPRTLGKQNSKMPKSFGGFGPRVDDPKGGETVNLPFGMSYKTLPEKDRDSAFGDN